MGVMSLVFLVSLVRAAASGQQPDVTVYSRYMSDQVLPCRFPSGNNPLVHWYKGRKDLTVLSYHRGQDRSAHQMDEFRRRTSLFHDQLSRGNASLLLKEVQVSDRGRYTCYTSNSRGDETAQESSVNLEVEAPVTKVSIVQEEDTITCRSEGIYPEPQVTWSRNKPADTRIEQTEQQLYNISSSVRVDDEGDYTCHVMTLRSNRSATLTAAKTSQAATPWWIPLLIILGALVVAGLIAWWCWKSRRRSATTTSRYGWYSLQMKRNAGRKLHLQGSTVTSSRLWSDAACS